MKRIILALVLLALSSGACAETGKDAVKALMKIQARCQTGVTYRDYTPLVGDAKLEINLYEKSGETKNSEMLVSLKRAMEHYQMASSVWSTKFGKYGRDKIEVNNKLASFYFGVYPGANKNRSEGGALIDSGRYMDVMAAVKYIWGEADKELTAISNVK